MVEKGILNMQNFGYDKAVFGSKYRVFASKNDYNHWLLSLSVRFCPNPQATPLYSGFQESQEGNMEHGHIPVVQGVNDSG